MYPLTNRLQNAGYDNNGNMTSGVSATFTYDEANRVSTVVEISGGEEFFGYDPANKRIYVRDTSANEWFTFYGAKGEKLGKYRYWYSLNPYWLFVVFAALASLIFFSNPVSPSIFRSPTRIYTEFIPTPYSCVSSII